MTAAAPDITIFHNPACGTSRNTLALIREAGVEPHIVEYLRTPPSNEQLLGYARAMGAPLRALLREKEPLCAELGLDRADVDDAALLQAMQAHPVLINRPIVVSPLGVDLCRPAEKVLALLPRR
jgi:arsenate reductase